MRDGESGRLSVWGVLICGTLVACGDGGTEVGVLPDEDLGAGGGDAGLSDAGRDTGLGDMGLPDVGGPDVGLDAGRGDLGAPDLGVDGGPDAGPMDAGLVDMGAPEPTVCMDRRADVPFPATGPVDRTVGDGTAGSCTEAALRTAVAAGGRIGFDCGESSPVIALAAPLTLDASSPDVVLDGAGDVTLDGGDASRLVVISGGDPATPEVALIGLTFRNGRAPTAGTDLERSGGAILHAGGPLVVDGCTFEDNEAALVGRDVAGGALSNQGNVPTFVVASSFARNRASNGGAVGTLQTPLVVLESTFTDNEATGSGGFAGTGGTGGAIYGDGTNRDWTLCGLEVRGNRAEIFGGGIFRVANTSGGSTVIERSLFEDNELQTTVLSLGGGTYLQGTAITVRESSYRGNVSWGGGAGFVGPNATLDMQNVMVLENEARGSLGGGLSVDGTVTGTLTHVTFAANAAVGDVSFAGALSGGDLRLEGCLFAENTAGNGFNAITCTPEQTDGGGNVQWPVVRTGAGSDDPGALCAAGATLRDPNLGPVVDRRGSFGNFAVRVPREATVVDVTGSCPATDLFGTARGATCTAGAVE